MTLGSKPALELTEADIRALVEAQIPEGKLLDYKRDLPGPTDADKKEFLFDVTSFANASGGHLVYGIQEDGGVAKQVCGLTVTNEDAEIRRLQNLILDAIDPRIPGVDLRFITVSGGTSVLLVHIPKSWALPHMVTFKGVNRFYSRNAAGKHPVDVDELRALFRSSDRITDQVKRFRTERISQILAEETPIGLQAGPKIILHIVPLEAFSAATRVDLKAASALPGGLLYPLGASGYNTRVNLDGLVTHTGAGFGTSGASAYLQLYRHGIIETVDASTLDAGVSPPGGARIIPSALFERLLIGQIPKYLLALQRLGLNPPFVIMLTLLGVKGFFMAVPQGSRMDFPSSIDRDVVAVSEIIVERPECSPVDLKPMLDAVWNAAGIIASPSFDPQGNQWP